eukprot:jgi/Hompol1/294/HPOL_005271-RA
MRMPIDLDSPFHARTLRSRQKAMRFFGEGLLPIQVGVGSTAKLEAFFGTGAPKQRNTFAISAPAVPVAASSTSAPSGLSDTTHLSSSGTNGSSSTVSVPAEPARLDSSSTADIAGADAASTGVGAHNARVLGATLVQALPSASDESIGSLISPTLFTPLDTAVTTHIAPAAEQQEHLRYQLQPLRLDTNSPSTAADALLLSANEPLSPTATAQDALDFARMVNRASHLSESSWRRRSSLDSANFARDAIEAGMLVGRTLNYPDSNAVADSGSLDNFSRTSLSPTWIHELRRSRSLTVSQMVQLDAIFHAHRHTQTSEISAESLLERALGSSMRTETIVNIGTSVRHSVASTTKSTDQPRANLVKSNRKIAAIFGEACPVDVPVRQITDRNLHLLLISRMPICYFAVFLLRRHTIETLFFVIDAQDFEQTVFPTNEALQNAAADLFNLYLIKDALLGLNVDHSVKRAVVDGIKSFSLSCFRSALKEAMASLEQIYFDFLTSSEYESMKSDLGMAVHDADAAIHAIELLRSAVPVVTSVLNDHRKQQVWAIHARLDILSEERLSQYLGNDRRARVMNT